MTGFKAITLESGTRFLALHYTADKNKDSDWVTKHKAGMDAEEWDREMELRENVWAGERVFKAYNDSFHCPAWTSEIEIKVLPGCHYIAGWDGGASLAPACVLGQLRPILVDGNPLPEWRLYILLEVFLEGAWSMEEFAPIVRDRLKEWSPEYAKKIRHVGDPTLMQRAGTDKRTAAEVALNYGFAISPSTNEWEVRRSAVSWHLQRKLSDGRAGYIVNGPKCPTLKSGFEGAYRYQKKSTADATGPGMVLNMPEKNAWSHVHDANEYLSIFAKTIIEGSGETKQTSRIKRRRRRM